MQPIVKLDRRITVVLQTLAWRPLIRASPDRPLKKMIHLNVNQNPEVKQSTLLISWFMSRTQRSPTTVHGITTIEKET